MYAGIGKIVQLFEILLTIRKRCSTMISNCRYHLVSVDDTKTGTAACKLLHPDLP